MLLTGIPAISHKRRISSYLPYDTARYSDADAVLVTYGSRPLRDIPEADTPALDEEYHITDEILYPCEITID